MTSYFKIGDTVQNIHTEQISKIEDIIWEGNSMVFVLTNNDNWNLKLLSENWKIVEKSPSAKIFLF